MSFGAAQSPQNNTDYIHNLIQMGHESVLEHATWTFFITGVSRAFSHQLVRHRAGFSFSQLSQQYHDESEARFVIPESLRLSPRAAEIWSDTVEQAKSAYKAILEEVSETSVDGEIAKAAIEYSRQEKRSHRSDEIRIVPLLDQFGDRQAESIRLEEFEQWLNATADARGWALATKNRYLALLKLTFRLAEKNGKIKVNPARLLRMRKENNARVRYLNQYKPSPTKIGYLAGCTDEETRLRTVIRTEYPHHLPEFEIGLNTGMRCSEQYRAKWPDVDFARHILTVRQSKHGEKRFVPLNSIALAMLEFLQARAPETEGDHVFLSMNNEPLTGNRHWFEDAVIKAGIRGFTWHDLRHTFASRLAMAGVDLRRIQELMGHKTIQMTCRYAHLAPADLLAAVEKLVPEPSATTGATGPESSGPSASRVVQ
jgi:site-specific recombinase XerD